MVEVWQLGVIFVAGSVLQGILNSVGYYLTNKHLVKHLEKIENKLGVKV